MVGIFSIWYDFDTFECGKRKHRSLCVILSENGMPIFCDRTGHTFLFVIVTNVSHRRIPLFQTEMKPSELKKDASPSSPTDSDVSSIGCATLIWRQTLHSATFHWFLLPGSLLNPGTIISLEADF